MTCFLVTASITTGFGATVYPRPADTIPTDSREFNDSIVIDRDHTFNSSYQTDEFRNRYRENLDNFSFLNPYCNDWEFGKNNNQDKKIMENLIKIRKSVNRKVVFYFNSIDFYSTPVQEMLKEKKIIDKIIDFKGIYY